MSSKWTAAKLQTKPPGVCKAPPPPPEPGPPPPPPTQLAAAAIWVDHDIHAWAHYAESFGLTLNGPPDTYHGQSGAGIPRLELDLARIGSTDYWNAVLSVYDQWRDPETYEWFDVFVDPDTPFYMSPPPLITIPGEDFQQIIVSQ